jgi:hypothetical protein
MKIIAQYVLAIAIVAISLPTILPPSFTFCASELTSFASARLEQTAQARVHTL